MNHAEMARLLLWVVAGAVANTVLGTLNRLLGLPLFLDSVFTAVLSATGGIGAGVATALLSQLLIQLALMVTESQVWGPTLPFVICQLATALIVGSLAKTGSLAKPLVLVGGIFAVALANAVLGSFVATFLFGGINLHGADFVAAGLMLGGQSLLEASFWARIPINLIDKGLAVGAAALALQWGFSASSPRGRNGPESS